MLTIDQAAKDALLRLGVSTHNAAPLTLPDDTILEPPCSLKWMNVAYRLRLGAFSYAVSGFYFGAEIGRYTSIGENVQIGRGSHPVSWASTSPILYQDHRSVVDFDIPQASDFVPMGEYIAPEPTIIGNDVYIGHGAFISQGVRIGDGAVVGAQAVVTRDVPPYAVVAGSPAEIKRFRFSERLVERYVQSRWWEFAFWDLGGISVVDPDAFITAVERRRTEEMVPVYRPDLVDVRDLFGGKTIRRSSPRQRR